MQRSISAVYGTDVGRAFILTTLVQFHLAFYMSRMLPNVFALLLTNMALAIWIQTPSRVQILYITLFAMVDQIHLG